MHPAGKRRDFVILKRPERTEDSDYNVVTTLVTARKVWAHIRPLKGRERFEAMQVQAEVSHEIIFPYEPDIDPDWEIHSGARVFKIESVVDVDERHVDTQCLCKERR